MSETFKSTPKDVFFHLLATVTLYMSVYAIIALLFSCINVLLPDALSFYYTGELDMIRLSVAMLMVTYPVYVLLMYLIQKDMTVEPGKHDIGARKWLTYLTIFLAAIMIIVDVITLIYNFLDGELTLRFFLKVLTVLAVSSTVFGFYLWDIRRAAGEKSGTVRLFAWGASAAVVVSIVLSFLVAGSPWHQRQVRFDERRVNDLQTVQNELVQYWQQKQALPATLNELQNNITGFVAPTDPDTGATYEYTVTGDAAFSLCATFATERMEAQNTSAVAYRGDAYGQNWNHAAGRTCFDRTIDPDMYPPYAKPIF